MEISGILSLILGALGTLSSYWYVGIVPCAAGLVLGIIGMKESYMDSKTSIMGLLLSVLGGIASIFFIVSDIDSGALALNAKRFGGEMISSEKDEDFMKFHREGWTPEQSGTEIPVEQNEKEQRPDYSEEIARMDWIHDEEIKTNRNDKLEKADEERNTENNIDYNTEEKYKNLETKTEEQKNREDYHIEPQEVEEKEIAPDENTNYNNEQDYTSNSSYNTISYEDIMRNPDGNKGKYCTISGTVDQIIEGWFGSFSIFIIDGDGNKWGCTYSYKDGESHLMEGDYVIVSGECMGTDTTRTVLGQQVTMPRIDIEKINR